MRYSMVSDSQRLRTLDLDRDPPKPPDGPLDLVRLRIRITAPPGASEATMDEALCIWQNTAGHARNLENLIRHAYFGQGSALGEAGFDVLVEALEE